MHQQAQDAEAADDDDAYEKFTLQALAVKKKIKAAKKEADAEAVRVAAEAAAKAEEQRIAADAAAALEEARLAAIAAETTAEVDEVQKLVTGARSRAPELSQSSQALDSVKQQVVDRQATARKEVVAFFDLYRAAERKVLEAVDSETARKLGALETQKSALQGLADDLGRACDGVSAAQSDGAGAAPQAMLELLRGSPAVAELRRLQAVGCRTEPCADARLEVQQAGKTSPLNLAAAEAALGSVLDVVAPAAPAAVAVSAPACAAQCAVEGLDPKPLVGKPTSFTLHVRDAGGQPADETERVVPGGVVRVDVRRAAEGGGADWSALAVPVVVAAAAGGGGAFDCTLAPPDDSALCVCVCVRGDHVPGSPFAVHPSAGAQNLPT